MQEQGPMRKYLFDDPQHEEMQHGSEDVALDRVCAYFLPDNESAGGAIAKRSAFEAGFSWLPEYETDPGKAKITVLSCLAAAIDHNSLDLHHHVMHNYTDRVSLVSDFGQINCHKNPDYIDLCQKRFPLFGIMKGSNHIAYGTTKAVMCSISLDKCKGNVHISYGNNGKSITFFGKVISLYPYAGSKSARIEPYPENYQNELIDRIKKHIYL